MKLSAVLARSKGRDFYDTLFLLSKVQPNYVFLSAKNNISNLDELKTAINALRHTVDLNQKKRDFQHLLIREENAERILQFWEYVEGL